MIIALAGLKGGVGKSTLAVAIAAEFHSRGHRVLLVDLDPLGTTRLSSDCAVSNERAGAPTVWLGGHAPSIADLEELAEGFDIVVIDGPPADPEGIDLLANVADLMLLPCPPRPADVWALGPVLARIRSVQDERPDLLSAVVLNAVPSRCPQAADIRDGLREQGITVAAATIGARVAHVRALEAGTGVTVLEPSGPAAAEVRALVHELGQWCPPRRVSAPLVH